MFTALGFSFHGSTQFRKLDSRLYKFSDEYEKSSKLLEMLFEIIFTNINRCTSNIPEKEHEQSSCDAEQKDLQEEERTLLHRTSLHQCIFWISRILQLLL